MRKVWPVELLMYRDMQHEGRIECVVLVANKTVLVVYHDENAKEWVSAKTATWVRRESRPTVKELLSWLLRIPLGNLADAVAEEAEAWAESLHHREAAEALKAKAQELETPE
jgi:hypothetical protein